MDAIRMWILVFYCASGLLMFYLLCGLVDKCYPKDGD